MSTLHDNTEKFGKLKFDIGRWNESLWFNFRVEILAKNSSGVPEEPHSQFTCVQAFVHVTTFRLSNCIQHKDKVESLVEEISATFLGKHPKLFISLAGHWY